MQLKRKKRKSKIPEINITMLGMKGAGKTVYLTALYNEFKQIGHEDYERFFVQTDNDTKNLLNNYISLLNSDNTWPTGTSGFHKLKFECYTAKSPAIPACRFNISDYAGGMLSESKFHHPRNLESLERDIANADILLGFLDGIHIANLFRDGLFPKLFSIWEKEELSRILTQMQGSSASVHLVITKWDYVQSVIPEITLEQVKYELLKINSFERLISSKRGKYIIRLIPISSVGADFISHSINEFKVKDGKINRNTMKSFGVKMRIKEGAKLAPRNIDIPLVYALYDPIKLAYMKSEREIKKMSFFEGLWNKVKEIFLDEFSAFLPPGLKDTIKKNYARWIIEAMENQVRKRVAMRSIAQANAERDSLYELVSCFSMRKMYFEKTLPGNRFS